MFVLLSKPREEGTGRVEVGLGKGRPSWGEPGALRGVRARDRLGLVESKCGLRLTSSGADWVLAPLPLCVLPVDESGPGGQGVQGHLTVPSCFCARWVDDSRLCAVIWSPGSLI